MVDVEDRAVGSGVRSGQSGWDALRWLPVVALLMVVVLHQYNVQVNHLASERGGGFGMFAIVDGVARRAVHLDLTLSDGRTQRVDLAEHREQLGFSAVQFERILTMPSEDTLDRLGERPLRASWDPRSQQLLSSSTGIGAAPDDGALAIEAVTITVVGVAYDPDTGYVLPAELTSRQVERQ